MTRQTYDRTNLWQDKLITGQTSYRKNFLQEKHRTGQFYDRTNLLHKKLITGQTSYMTNL